MNEKNTQVPLGLWSYVGTVQSSVIGKKEKISSSEPGEKNLAVTQVKILGG